MIKTFEDCKELLNERHPDYILLFQIGEFLECIGEDAKTIGDELVLVVSGRTNRVTNLREPKVGFPVHKEKEYVKELTKLGYKVAVVSCSDYESFKLYSPSGQMIVEKI